MKVRGLPTREAREREREHSLAVEELPFHQQYALFMSNPSTLLAHEFTMTLSDRTGLLIMERIWYNAWEDRSALKSYHAQVFSLNISFFSCLIQIFPGRSYCIRRRTPGRVRVRTLMRSPIWVRARGLRCWTVTPACTRPPVLQNNPLALSLRCTKMCRGKQTDQGLKDKTL